MSQKNTRIVTKSRISGQSLENPTFHRRSKSLNQIVRFDSKTIPDEPKKIIILKQIQQNQHIKLGQKDDNLKSILSSQQQLKQIQQKKSQKQTQQIFYDNDNHQIIQQQQQEQLQQQITNDNKQQQQEQQQSSIIYDNNNTQQQSIINDQNNTQQQSIIYDNNNTLQQQQQSSSLIHDNNNIQQQQQIINDNNQQQQLLECLEDEEIDYYDKDYEQQIEQINLNSKINQSLQLNKELYLHKMSSQNSSNYSEMFKPLQKFDQFIPKISYPTSFQLQYPTIDNKTSSQDALPKRDFDTTSNFSQETSQSIRQGSIKLVGGAELQKVTSYNMDYIFKIEKLNPNFSAYGNIPLMDLPLSNKTSNREQFKVLKDACNNQQSKISSRPKNMIDIIPKDLLIKNSCSSEQFKKFENVQRQLPGIRGPSQKQVFYPTITSSKHFTTMNNLQFPKRGTKISFNKKQSLTDRYQDKEFKQQYKLIENL